MVDIISECFEEAVVEPSQYGGNIVKFEIEKLTSCVDVDQTIVIRKRDSVETRAVYLRFLLFYVHE